jgi:hypothetical protein
MKLTEIQDQQLFKKPQSSVLLLFGMSQDQKIKTVMEVRRSCGLDAAGRDFNWPSNTGRNFQDALNLHLSKSDGK